MRFAEVKPQKSKSNEKTILLAMLRDVKRHQQALAKLLQVDPNTRNTDVWVDHHNQLTEEVTIDDLKHREEVIIKSFIKKMSGYKQKLKEIGYGPEELKAMFKPSRKQIVRTLTWTPIMTATTFMLAVNAVNPDDAVVIVGMIGVALDRLKFLESGDEPLL